MTIVVVLSASGAAIGRQIAGEIGAPLHGRTKDADQQVTDYPTHLRALFTEGHTLIFVGALGALVRMLAPVLSDKETDPPVVAVAEDGGAVIPVLGGHHGANDLACEIAALLKISPAITTASDLAFGAALDDPPHGWTLADKTHYKGFASRLLAGEAVSIEGDIPWLTIPAESGAEGATLTIRADDRAADNSEADCLLYHPATLAVGVGCERGAEPSELIALIQATLAEAGLAPASIAALCSLDVKMDEAAVHAAAEAFRCPARFFSADRLEQETPRLANPSDVVFRAVGCHGVAEGAALAAAGDGGALTVTKRRSKRATCAIARAPSVIDADKVGMARGRLFVVGTGPGDAGWRTPETDRLIREASDLIGYDLYLDLLGAAAAGKQRHAFKLGEERARVTAALNLAATGRTVALVSSGDPGIYAMASLVFDCLGEENHPDWRADWQRVAITVSPGVSAMQACAARIGAPLGHDFCAISLSDLLTPWAVIERRIKAAAEGDFVIAFYNPASGRRRQQLVRALEILTAARPADTPVILARALGRAEETITTARLADFRPETVDMLSLVMVGSSQTRPVRDYIYTPRGYREAGEADGESGANNRERSA